MPIESFLLRDIITRMRFFKYLLKIIHGNGQHVFALVGPSGTGKSYRAKPLAKQLRAELIIDDGLLIYGEKILAGHSAKKEKNFLGAVKTALFEDKSHRDNTAKALQEHKHKKILILGTSEKMVNKIAERLQLPKPEKIIKIEDIATQEEIEIARCSRQMEGKHVIPVPSLEIQRSYPQIFYDRVRLLFKGEKQIVRSSQSELFEKSVVRPEFSKTTVVKVPYEILKNSILKYAKEFDNRITLKEITINLEENGYAIVLIADLPFNVQLAEKVNKLQKFIIENIERNQSTAVSNLNIIIDKIINSLERT